MAILKKVDSAKAFFVLFCTILHSENLVIYAFMGHYLTSIDVFVCLDNLKFDYTPCYSLLYQVKYIKTIAVFYSYGVALIEWSSQVPRLDLRAAYGHVLVHRWHLYFFEVVLVFF